VARSVSQIEYVSSPPAGNSVAMIGISSFSRGLT
jgi:hypothetical protein